jgi:hypothetical protein
MGRLRRHDDKAQRRADWPTWVYLFKEGDGDSGFLKIGFADDMQQRAREIQTGNPRQIELGFALRVRRRHMAKNLEAAFLKRAARQIIIGEWIAMPLPEATSLLVGLANECKIDVLGYAPGSADIEPD